MKKHLLWLPVLIITVFTFRTNVENIIHPAKPVDKQISFAIYTKNNYTAPVYNEALAKVQVMVTKVKGASKSIVWQKTFDAMPLKKYPGISKAFTQKVNIPNVLDGREQLIVSYSVTYDTKGSVLEFVNGEVVSKGIKKNNLFISI